LLLILKIQALLLTLAGAFILARISHSKVTRTARVSGSSLVLIAGWWLIDPAALFAFSWVTGDSVFVSRYLYLALPGVALMAGTIVSLFVPEDCWKPIALAVGCGVLLFMGQWRQLWPAHHNSDWRGAAAALRGWVGGEKVPVISPSPFIEAQPPVWRPDYPRDGFLYSDLSVYPAAGQVYPFPFMGAPFVASADVAKYAGKLVTAKLAPAKRFAIYGGDRSVESWRRWFASRPELRGWQSKKIGSFGDVELAVLCADYCK
jgi:hypothetical protein